MSSIYQRIKDRIADWFDTLAFVIHFMRNLLKARKWTIQGLAKDTNLTKRQAKKIVDDTIPLVTKWVEEDTSIEDGGFSNLEYNLLIIYFIRNNKSYSQDVHKYCDDDLKLINEMVNEDDDREEWLTLAHYKRLNLLIDKYQNSFDKFRESKKYSGIWY